MTELIISIDDLLARAELREIESRIKNLRPAFASMGEFMMRRIDDNFRGQHDPDFVAWAPLSAAYRKRKKGTKILTESGRLRSSITYLATTVSVTVGTNTKYARAHQLGYSKRNLPARPYMGASAQDEEELGKILLDYLGGNP
ncbi:hypothetical protein NIES4101_53740 [Calothrix sp. NIES-4101]|nr:hypothetical protein NIES4101_53740 [Calothrix sp. NIES-4101]